MDSRRRKSSLAMGYHVVVEYLDRIEDEERVRALPHLVVRAPNVEIGDVVPVDDRGGAVVDDDNDGGAATTTASLRKAGLREFSPSLLLHHQPSHADAPPPPLFSYLTTLDVSNNELRDLPGLSSLPNLLRLSIQRNWFDALPSDVDHLSKLIHLDASRNFLRPNRESLRYDGLRRLTCLRVLDFSYNGKIRRADHRDAIRAGILPSTAEVVITAWEETMTTRDCYSSSSSSSSADAAAVSPRGEEGSTTTTTTTTTATAMMMYVGTSAAVRDPRLLRSQLEPWSTFVLRRRLVTDFGEIPTDPAHVDRASVMNRLLDRYMDEGLSYFDDEDEGSGGRCDRNAAVGKRRILRIDGEPVRDELLREILTELREWRGDVGRGGGSGGSRERPSVRAECYMILRADCVVADDGGPACDVLSSSSSRRARRRKKKMDGNQRLWALALRALRETDPDFATRCSEVAVTLGFAGSPHIDKQNSSPFYGLALGDFDDGTGCLAVECSARVIAVVNTRNKLGRVDGRYPHWVTNYDAGQERYSLIYYDTMSTFESPGPAIFRVP
ncbi:hypothetical protein ACHAW5_001714 [Stephanodiscus triporus]|uniref:Uncharacterized protein n=1 Tax=Stephanodiscus triporus TaxID=2934178 RepID=A0ABD3P297_9STRA